MNHLTFDNGDEMAGWLEKFYDQCAKEKVIPNVETAWADGDTHLLLSVRHTYPYAVKPEDVEKVINV